MGIIQKRLAQLLNPASSPTTVHTFDTVDSLHLSFFTLASSTSTRSFLQEIAYLGTIHISLEIMEVAGIAIGIAGLVAAFESVGRGLVTIKNAYDEAPEFLKNLTEKIELAGSSLRVYQHCLVPSSDSEKALTTLAPVYKEDFMVAINMLHGKIEALGKILRKCQSKKRTKVGIVKYALVHQASIWKLFQEIESAKSHLSALMQMIIVIANMPMYVFYHILGYDV